MEDQIIPVSAVSGWELFFVLVATIILMLFSALTSAAETALTAVSKARLHQLEKEGEVRARSVNWLMAHREQMIGAILLSNTFVNVVSSALVTTVLVTLFGNAGVAVGAIGITALVLIFCEVLPKTYAITNADGTALSIGRPVRIAVSVLSPIVDTIQWFVALILRAMGVRSQGLVEDKEEAADAAHEELRGAIDLHHIQGAVQTSDRNMLGGILDLKDLQVSDIMIHRKNMVAIDGDVAPEDMLDRVLSQPHTRLPVFKGDPDNVVGVLHAKDVLRAMARAGGNIKAVNVMSLAAKPWFIPDTTPVANQLRAFLQRRNHFAVVVDEYGTLQGMITLEDILEQIVGDIRDEHDLPVSGVRPQPDGTINVDGWVTIRELNRVMNWRLPDEEATTVAGLVIHEAQAIPDVAQVFSFHGFKFEVLRRQKNQIMALRITPPAAMVAASG